MARIKGANLLLTDQCKETEWNFYTQLSCSFPTSEMWSEMSTGKLSAKHCAVDVDLMVFLEQYVLQPESYPICCRQKCRTL